MIRAFVGAIAMLLVAGAGAVGPAIPDRRGVAPLAVAGTGAVPAARDTEGSDSTPGVFALPQLGSAGFVCGPDWEVRPFFDLGSALATEALTIRAGPSRGATSATRWSAGFTTGRLSSRSSRARGN
jgi:hypothetical protein